MSSTTVYDGPLKIMVYHERHGYHYEIKLTTTTTNYYYKYVVTFPPPLFLRPIYMQVSHLSYGGS